MFNYITENQISRYSEKFICLQYSKIKSAVC